LEGVFVSVWKEKAGSARLVLADLTVAPLHREDRMFEAMLTGWEQQQRGGRRLKEVTVRSRVAVVQGFQRFADEYPWNWTAVHVDEWMHYLIHELERAESTIRGYQLAVRMFCDYITSPHYQWPEECEQQFGTHPVQVCHEWNTAAHVQDYEGSAHRRPMTREELQEFFDYADAQVEEKIRRGRKGALAAYRDATIFKTIYGWGLRCNECSKLETVDFLRNNKAPELGRFGALRVRWGKSHKGSPPKPRTVLSVMPWAVEAVEDYLVNVRPRYQARNPVALWPTERGGRLRTREIDDRFAEYRDAIGLDKDLVPHSLRHSYVTHLIEDGADAKFVQDQVGHAYSSTTGLYTGVSGDFMNTQLRKILDRTLAGARPQQ
jgi:site-specific recombinase XerD